ncbi:hypothetical protein GIB67_031631, partial [Kingdonia uniflora]
GKSNSKPLFVSCVFKVCKANYNGIGNGHHEYDRADTMFEKRLKPRTIENHTSLVLNIFGIL